VTTPPNAAPDFKNPKPMRPPWQLLTLLVAMSTIGPVSLNIIVPAVPGLTLLFNTDPATIQLTVSLYLFALAFAQLALGPLSDHFGRRPVVPSPMSRRRRRSGSPG
jgi:DHA1 family bicyclomycin/chloramphenicol resistance-like MFS transporter